MNKLLGILGAVVLGGGLAVAPAGATTARPTTISSASASRTGVPMTAGDTFSMRDRFARETVHYGQADRGVYKIAHVRELQYRLRWAGTFGADVTGTFGSVTRIAVRRYQRSQHIRVTGIANHVTWAHLLRDTIRHRGAIPRACRRAGWHACYDRSMHQVVLLHSGVYRNTWLVRGGSYDKQTRVGTHRVYYRDIDHTSGLYDGSPMPYAQFFDGGQALHGSAYMIDPFVDHSHGCINMYIEDARQLWMLTSTRRLIVTVYGAWD